MKIGNKIYCIKDFIDLDKGDIWCSKDKSYTICCDNSSESFYIIDNQGDKNYYIIDVAIFNKYFHTEKELRKLKLEKLNESWR